MRIASSFAASIFVAAVVVSCGGSNTDLPGDPPVTEKTVESLAGSFCDRLALCYGDFFIKAFLGEPATCKSRLGAELKASTKGAGYQAKESQMLACKNAVDATTCDKLLDDTIPECDLRGTLADGAACSGNAQCASGACFVDDAKDCGTCGQRVPEGGDCTKAKCERGLTCTEGPPTGPRTCGRRGADGASCGPNGSGGAVFPPCQTKLMCISGKCGAGLAAGTACKNGDGEKPCDQASGLYCKPPNATVKEGTCQAFSVANAGQPCGLNLAPIDYSFCQNSQCIGASGGKKGTCTAYLADGSTCDPNGESDCQFPAKCRNGKCALLDPNVCK